MSRTWTENNLHICIRFHLRNKARDGALVFIIITIIIIIMEEIVQILGLFYESVEGRKENISKIIQKVDCMCRAR